MHAQPQLHLQRRVCLDTVCPGVDLLQVRAAELQRVLLYLGIWKLSVQRAGLEAGRRAATALRFHEMLVQACMHSRLALGRCGGKGIPATDHSNDGNQVAVYDIQLEHPFLQ